MATNIVCPDGTICQGDFPGINVSAESPDDVKYIGLSFGSYNNRTIGLCSSSVSQSQADSCASSNAHHNTAVGNFGGNGQPPPNPDDFWNGFNVEFPPIDPGVNYDNWRLCENRSGCRAVQYFWNQAVTQTVCCQGGPCFSFTTPEGYFVAADIGSANTLAAQWARRQVILALLADPSITQSCRDSFTPPDPPTTTDRRYPVPVYNDPQTCQVCCSDGSCASYTTPAGRFPARTLALANAAAHQFACDQAALRRVCLGTLSETLACANEVFTATASVGAVNQPVTVNLIGTLPPGLFLSQTPQGILIDGTPTTPGNYAFTLMASDEFGNSNQRNYVIGIVGITSSTLPSGTVGAAYTTTLQSAGGAFPYTYTLSGTLPPGLGLNPTTGVISGTPTTVGTYHFDVFTSDASENVDCPRTITMVVSSALCTTCASWPHPVNMNITNFGAVSTLAGCGSCDASVDPAWGGGLINVAHVDGSGIENCTNGNYNFWYTGLITVSMGGVSVVCFVGPGDASGTTDPGGPLGTVDRWWLAIYCADNTLFQGAVMWIGYKMVADGCGPSGAYTRIPNYTGQGVYNLTPADLYDCPSPQVVPTITLT